MSDPSTDTAAVETNQEQLTKLHDERSNALMGEFVDKLDKEGIKTAIVIAVDPSLSEPIIHIRGHQYQVTRLTCGIARRLKTLLLNCEDLSV